MELQLLGTGAADGIPGLFSEDRVSQHARQHGGKNLRTRSAALLDRTLKIDLPPDTLHQCLAYNLSPSEWSAVIFTHSHDDHFAVPILQYALYPFVPNESPPFAIFGNEVVISKIKARYPDWPLELHVTKSFEPVQHENYYITPIAANHDPDEDCHNLLIKSRACQLLYATDTGYWGGPTWDFLRGQSIDCLVMECTDGLNPSGYSGHLDIQAFVKTVQELRRMNVLGASASIITTHHSHSGNVTHEELEKLLEPFGILAGFDGMVQQVGHGASQVAKFDSTVDPAGNSNAASNPNSTNSLSA